MPISVQTPIIEHAPNGVTTVFAYPFAILEEEDLKATLDGVAFTAFTVSGVGSRTGGSITCTSAPSGSSLILYREISLDRATDYQELGDLLAETLDDDFDRVWMALQDQLLIASRAIRAPLGESFDELPDASSRALRVLGFDSSGAPIMLTRTDDGGSALALALLDATSPLEGSGIVAFGAQEYAQGTIGGAVLEVRDHLFGRDGTTLKSYGDSITKGGAVTNPFPTLLATLQDWTKTNYGIDGAQTHDVAVPMYGHTIGATDNITVACGINNMRVSASSATKLRYFRQSHAALVAYAAIPDSKKLLATDARVTYSANWANNNTYGSTVNKYSITQGSTASFELTGSVIYIGLTMTETATGTVRVTVDGVSKGVYSCAAPGITTPLGQAFGPRLIRIPLQQGGRHDVVLTVVSATAPANNVFFDWAAGVDQASGPKVYVGNITYMDATGYGTYGGSDSLVDEYNRVISENCIQFAKDGLRVFYVDSNEVINPATDLADHLHPTQAGYQKIANEFSSVATARIDATAPYEFRPMPLLAAELAYYVGFPGELTYSEDTDTIQLHDGVTPGSAGYVQAPTFLNSWVNTYATSNGLSPVRFYRDGAGVVHIEGHPSGGTVGAGTPIFTLPDGYRPIETKIFPVISNDAFGKLAVYANGNVSLITGSNTYVSLEGISFRAA